MAKTPLLSTGTYLDLEYPFSTCYCNNKTTIFFPCSTHGLRSFLHPLPLKQCLLPPTNQVKVSFPHLQLLKSLFNSKEKLIPSKNNSKTYFDVFVLQGKHLGFITQSKND